MAWKTENSGNNDFSKVEHETTPANKSSPQTRRPSSHFRTKRNNRTGFKNRSSCFRRCNKRLRGGKGKTLGGNHTTNVFRIGKQKACCTGWNIRLVCSLKNKHHRDCKIEIKKASAQVYVTAKDRCTSSLHSSEQLTHSHPGFELQSGKRTRGYFIRVFHNMPSLCDAWAAGEDHITYNYISHSTANKLLTQWKGIKSSADPKHRSKLHSAAGKHTNMRLQTPVREIRKGNQEDKRKLFIKKVL